MKIKFISVVVFSATLFLFLVSFSRVLASALFLEDFSNSILPSSLNYSFDENFGEWLIDGDMLVGRKTAAGGGAVMSAISKRGFGLGNNNFTYSVDIGRPLTTVPGGSGVGMIIGNYKFIFHPGYPKDTDGAKGAFRIEKDLRNSETIIPNQDIGFIPKLGEMHSMQAIVHRQRGKVLVEVDISGVGNDNLEHSFNYLFETNSLGSGKIGVVIQGTNPPGTNGGFFDNLTLTSD